MQWGEKHRARAARAASSSTSACGTAVGADRRVPARASASRPPPSSRCAPARARRRRSRDDAVTLALREPRRLLTPLDALPPPRTVRGGLEPPRRAGSRVGQLGACASSSSPASRRCSPPRPRAPSSAARRRTRPRCRGTPTSAVRRHARRARPRDDRRALRPRPRARRARRRRRRRGALGARRHGRPGLGAPQRRANVYDDIAIVTLDRPVEGVTPVTLGGRAARAWRRSSASGSRRAGGAASPP